MKTEKWEKRKSLQYWWHECSKCGAPWDSFKQGWLPIYCPNCGAKMTRR